MIEKDEFDSNFNSHRTSYLDQWGLFKSNNWSAIATAAIAITAGGH